MNKKHILDATCGSRTIMKLSCNAMYETSCRSIGKTVFLTREDAEKALRKEDI